MQVGAPRVQFEIKALCFNLWVVSTALLAVLARKVPVLTFVHISFWKRFGKRFGKRFEKRFEKRFGKRFCVGRQRRPTAR